MRRFGSTDRDRPNAPRRRDTRVDHADVAPPASHAGTSSSGKPCIVTGFRKRSMAGAHRREYRIHRRRMRTAVVHGFGHRDSRRPTVEDESSHRILEFVYETVHDCTVARVVFARVNRRGEAAGSLLRPVDEITTSLSQVTITISGPKHSSASTDHDSFSAS